MTESRPFSFSLRVFIGIATFGLTLYFMREASNIINTLMLGIIIVLSASPLLHWFQRKKAPDWLAYVLTLTAIVAVFGVLVVMLVVAVNRLAESIPTYQTQLQDLQQETEQFLEDLGLAGVELSDAIGLVSPEDIVNWILNFLGGLVGVFSDLIVVGLIVIFLLIDTFSIPQKMAAELKAGNTYVKRVFDFGTDIRQYVYITTVVGLVTGLLDTMLFFAMGVDFAVLWGILAFLLSFIPTIGFWLAAIPPTFLALLESGPITALVVFLGIVVINGFAENVVKPRSMGSGLNLSPFVVVFSVIFWSGVLGPFGAILSIPMTLIVKELILEVDEQNAWMARFLSASEGSEPPTTPEEEQVAAASEQSTIP
ncbi:MAG TPA: AI-2E family transporter [Anaerolineae bacterium]|jgi:predicted PurR-regulated permease PerM|nr:AI-2E family transporter [Anaerolineae bacterium]